MSHMRPEFERIFADNDGAGGLRASVVSYRQKTGQISGGGGDGMEPRIARLEAHVEHIQRDVGELRQDSRELKSEVRAVQDRLAKGDERLARLEERVSHLPGKGFVVTTVLLALAVIAALVAFQSRIEGFVDGRPVSTQAAAAVD